MSGSIIKSNYREIINAFDQGKQQLQNQEFEKAFDSFIHAIKHPSSKEALKFQKEAAAQLAQLGMSLGDKYKKSNPKQAIHYYTIAAEVGNSKALSKIVHLYARKGLETRSPDDAVKWYKIAAGKENAVAMEALGRSLQKANPKRSFAWHYKSATKGYSEAMIRLGFCYEKGIGTIQDTHLAMAWYKRAAKKGNAKARRHVERIGKIL